jgi:hypothetical protein
VRPKRERRDFAASAGQLVDADEVIGGLLARP